MSHQDRPKWQLDRGERFGNLRRQEAELKVRRRRNDRAARNAETRRLVKELL